MSINNLTYGAENPASLAAKFISGTNKNIFLTGKAGTGKTTFLRSIIQSTYKSNVVVAPTGIAAINANGVTIHSMFQIPPGGFLPVNTRDSDDERTNKFQTAFSMIRQQRMGREKIKVLRRLELLVIDEVSMLRADLLDAMDAVLKSVRRNHNRPFGGVQVLFIGDLLQLPPVIKDDEWSVLSKYYTSPFFFDAHVLRDNAPLTIELNKIYRQSDETFVTVLNNLRNNKVGPKDIDLLNQYYKPGYYGIPQDKYIQLTTHNHKADAINKAALQKLKTKTERFKATVKDTFPEKIFPNDEELELKAGAQVMFLINDKDKRFFNGKIGTLVSVSEDRDALEVKFEDETGAIWVERHTWENYDYVPGAGNSIVPKIVGKFTQFPVKLAWAITVHKSQGLTFRKAIIDLEQAFAPGQIYVALSRLTSLDGLVLSSRINYSSLRLHDSVKWHDAQRESPEELENIFTLESRFYVQQYVVNRFDLQPLVQNIVQIIEEGGSGKSKSTHARYRAWGRTLINELQPAEDTSAKFITQIKHIGADWTRLLERVGAAKEYFTPYLNDIIATIDKHVKSLQGEKKIKTYLDDINEMRDMVTTQLYLYDRAEVLLQAVINNSEMTKEVLMVAEDYPRPYRKNDPDEKEEKQRARSSSGPFRGVSKSRNVKGDSIKLTFDLVSQGKSIDEIANERRLSRGTVESHVVDLIKKGKCQPEQFVEKLRLENIRIAAKELGTTQLTPIRQHLGDEYSYTELRMALIQETTEYVERGRSELYEQSLTDMKASADNPQT